MIARARVVEVTGHRQIAAVTTATPASVAIARPRPRPPLRGDPGHAGRGEEHQQRHQREAVAREDVEGHGGDREGRRDRVEHPQPAAIRPGQPRRRRPPAAPARRSGSSGPSSRSGHDHSACDSWLSVSIISAAFTSSTALRASSRQPGARIVADEVERPRRPVARHLGRRQRAPGGALGQLGGVDPLELRRAAAEAQRRVAAVGARVVADVEVGPELRGGEIDAAAHGVVADDDRAEHQRDADGERRQRAGAARGRAAARRSTAQAPSTATAPARSRG